MANSSIQFDPYYKWLGIPLADQPPNHYRLLGIQIFESDQDVIANAADQRMTHVRSFQTGRYSAESQRLLNELAAARVCLLKPEQKARYDAALKAKQPAVIAKPVDRTFENLASIIGDEDLYASRARSRPKRREMPVIAITVILVFIVTAAIASFVYLRDKKALPVAQEKAASFKEPSAPLQTKPKGSGLDRKQSTSVAPVAKPVSDVRLPNIDSELAKPKAPLPVVEVSAGPAVVTVEKMQPLPLRIGPRPAFLIEATFYDWVKKPKQEIDNGLLRFHIEKSGIVYLAPTWRREGVDGKWKKFQMSKERLIELGWEEVGACDWDNERTLFKRFCKQGESHSLRTNKFWPPIIVLEGLPAEDFSSRVKDIEEGGWSNPGAVTSTAPKPLSPAATKPEEIELLEGKWVDVLRLVVPKTHSVQGDWKRLGPAVTINSAEDASRIVVPFAPTGSYDLTVEFTRTKGDAADLILPIAGRQCLLSLDKTGTSFDCLPRLKDVEVSAVARHKLSVQVRVDGSAVRVEADLDDEPFIHWQGIPNQLSLSDGWKLPGVGQIGLGAGGGGAVTFHSLKLREQESDSRSPQQRDPKMLAADTHLGKAATAKNEENHIYHLQSLRSVSLANTTIRFQIDPETIRTSGRVLISGDGNDWTQVGNWTRESCKAASEHGGWQEVNLSAMPQANTKELYVKFDWTSGSGSMLIHDVQWIDSNR